MNPVTGPFYKQVIQKDYKGGDSSKSLSYKWSQWYRQRRPYNLPLRYNSESTVVGVRRSWDGSLSYSATDNFNAAWRSATLRDISTSGDPHVPWFTYRRDYALNKALTKFNERRGEKAALAVTLAEMGKTVSMIERRALQTLKVVKSLRKGRFGDAAAALGINRDRLPGYRRRQRANDAASLQLEISFGWKPFIQDMSNAIGALEAPFPYGVTRGSGTVSDVLNVGNSGWHATHRVKFQAYVAAVLELEHPNLGLASRLGLTNPFGVVFELIPWSFVANWLFNFEEYLASFDDYLGVKVSNPHYGIKMTDDFTMYKKEDFNPLWFQSGSSTSVSFGRVAGSLPGMRFGLRPSVSLPFGRALNAVSLLVQQGIRNRR